MPGAPQRAYTLRLRGEGTAWREALWATHEAVNKGAKAFGDWLLTLRGGLCHTLVDMDVPTKGKNPARKPTDEERRDRRVLLALSWLSVEHERGAPKADGLRVATGKDSAEARGEAVKATLLEILKGRGVKASEVTGWLDECGASLEARIREDAVWVNRSKAFDEMIKKEDQAKAREDCRILLWSLFTDDYLALPRKQAEPKEPAGSEIDQQDEQSENTVTEQRLAAVVKSGKGAGQRTRHPFSHLFGEGKPFGNPKRSLSLRDFWNSVLKPRIEESGIPLRPVDKKRGNKGSELDTGRSQTELHREMFSKAAARLAQIWTKQKQQDVEREERRTADEALKEMERKPAYADALRSLSTYSEQYRMSSGAVGEFRIRPAQVTGWDRVVKKWAAISENNAERAEELRIDLAKGLQDDPDEKFGDINLFIRLAASEYRSVWWHNGKPNADILMRFIRAKKARSDAERLKVASYRHPHPYYSPVFCQFGVSRPTIEFRRLKDFTNKPAGQDLRAVGLLLWDGAEADVHVLLGQSKRLDAEIGSACDSAVKDGSHLPEVSRRTRLGAAAAGLPAGGLSKVAGVFDPKPVKKRGADVGEEEGTEGKVKQPRWNGTLSTDRRALEVIAALLDRARRAKTDPSERKKLEQRADKRRQQLRWTLTVSMELEAHGPWYDFIRNAPDKAPFERTVRRDQLNDKDDESSGLRRKAGDRYISTEGWPWEEVNKPLKNKENLNTGENPSLVDDKSRARGSHARLVLCRLPGLRVLAVDLGHRYAAACAVWEAMSSDQFAKEREHAREQGAKIESTDLYVQVLWPERETNAATKKARQEGRVKRFHPLTVYRRIGADKLPDGADHPAPWARLDRQFLIKLQGEDKPARESSDEEIWRVHRWEAGMGLAAPLVDRLIRAGWGKTDKQSARLGALNALGWTPLAESAAATEAARTKRPPSLSVDELMSATVQNARLALRRHADRARIAFGLMSDHEPMPGDRKFWFHKPQDDDTEPQSDADSKATKRAARHTDYLQDVLVLWYELAVSGKWRDDDALTRWNDAILPLIQKVQFTGPPPLSEEDQKNKDKSERHKNKVKRWRDIWDNILSKALARPGAEAEDLREGRERKADREALHALIEPAAQALRQNEQLRRELSTKWADHWLGDEGPRRCNDNDPARSDFSHIEGKDAHDRKASTTAPNVTTSGWHARLREIGDWLLSSGPRGPGPDTDAQTNARRARGQAMNVGGLSLIRIDALVEFRRALVQFRTAGTPWGRVEIGKDAKPTNTARVAPEKYAQRLLDVIDQLRVQRSKQLASRVAEAALGVGREHLRPTRREPIRKCWCGLAHGKKDPERIGERAYPSCHAVVIERLDNYKPDEIRGKRENRLLASWRKAEFKKRLAEACQLHGLHLREVQPGHTSRQCSRTGLPGLRCDDVRADDFLMAPWWRKAVNSARKRIRDGGKDRLDCLFVALDEKWNKIGAEELKNVDLFRLARKGGDLFVAAPPPSCLSKGHDPCPLCNGKRALQADLNAAANIGLRALFDPDWPGRWWYVPCNPADYKPHKEKVHGSNAIGLSNGLRESQSQRTTKRKEDKKDREIVNLWRDPSGDPINAHCGPWEDHSKYWNGVRCRVIHVLHKHNGLGGAP